MATTKNKQEQLATKVASLEDKISKLKDQNLTLEAQMTNLSQKFSSDVKNLYDAFKTLAIKLDKR